MERNPAVLNRDKNSNEKVHFKNEHSYSGGITAYYVFSQQYS